MGYFIGVEFLRSVSMYRKRKSSIKREMSCRSRAVTTKKWTKSLAHVPLTCRVSSLHAPRRGMGAAMETRLRGSQGIKPKYNINEGAEPMFCSSRMLLSAQRLHRFDHVDFFGRLERSRWSYGNQPIKELNFAIASTPIIRIVLRPLKMRFHISRELKIRRRRR